MILTYDVGICRTCFHAKEDHEPDDGECRFDDPKHGGKCSCHEYEPTMGTEFEEDDHDLSDAYLVPS